MTSEESLMPQPVTAPAAESETRDSGVCQQCGRTMHLRKDGMVRQHGAKLQHVWPPQTCAGSGAQPKMVSSS